MTPDNLRDRIRAVLERAAGGENDWPIGTITATPELLADAVIRELRLTEEHSEWPFDGKHRYVTEWMASWPVPDE